MDDEKQINNVLKSVCEGFYDALTLEEKEALKWLSNQSIDNAISIASIISKAKVHTVMTTKR